MFFLKLSARLIVHHLQTHYALKASPLLGKEPGLSAPIYYRKGRPLRDGHVYLVTEPDFVLDSHRLKDTLFILTCPSVRLSEQSYPNFCILTDAPDDTEVLAFLQDVFSLYEQWNQSLINSRFSGGSIQNLLDLTDCIIPNPMMLIGMDFTIVASKKMDLPDLNGAVLGSSEATHQIINSLKADPNYENAFYRTGYFYYPGNETTLPSLCVNITSNNRAVYRLLFMEGEAPLDDTFGFLLEYLARIITHALTTGVMRGHDTAYPLHQIFTTILTEPGSDYVRISRQLSSSGWLSSHFYICILIKTGLMDQKNLTLRSICSYIENTIGSCSTVEHRGNAVAFINLSLCTMTTEEICAKLEGFLQSSMLSAGCSRKLLGHFNFHRQYVQASVALEMGKQKDPAAVIHHFNPVALNYILEQATKKLPAYMICHEKLLHMKYLDESNHSQLYRTLRCYLENHQSIARTSEALFIHRSTLLYRLDKIREYLGTDLSDPEELLYLLLSFWLLDHEETHESK